MWLLQSSDAYSGPVSLGVAQSYLNLCLSLLRRFWRHLGGGLVEALLFLANLGMTNYCPKSDFFC